jgi:hypothetical protein
MAAHQVGASMAALGAGVIRAQLGAYQLAFMTSGGMCLVAATMALAIGRRGRAVELAGEAGGPA